MNNESIISEYILGNKHNFNNTKENNELLITLNKLQEQNTMLIELLQKEKNKVSIFSYLGTSLQNSVNYVWYGISFVGYSLYNLLPVSRKEFNNSFSEKVYDLNSRDLVFTTENNNIMDQASKNKNDGLTNEEIEEKYFKNLEYNTKDFFNLYPKNTRQSDTYL